MKKVFLLVFFILLFLHSSLEGVYSAINYTVTPIKYELELNPGGSITLPASLRNNGTGTVTLPTTSSDFQTSGTGGTPSFVRKSELVFPDQQLSTWITISQPSITLAPGEEKSINFTIDVPTDATPGGHYGAVFFKNDGSEVSSSGNIGINVDYGVIVLVNVSGDVIVDIDIGDPIVSGGGSSTDRDVCPQSDKSGSLYDGTCDGDNAWYIGNDENGNPIYEYPDSCPLGDFTPSRYDGFCIGSVPDENLDDDISNPEGFEVDFTIPVDNKGNTHIKPEGKIILKDENGNIIKAIGKKTIINDRGAVIGEEIVDYIPINDQGGNVLPKTKRVYESQWKGFPYKSYDDSGNQIVNYRTPSQYYTDSNKNDSGFLMFWERVSEVRQHKIITAEIEIIYYDEQGNPIEFTTAKEFPIQYIEQRVTLNPYIILALLLLGTILLMSFFAVRWWILVAKKKKCWNCRETIKSHWQACPHCEALQNKKKHRALERQKEESKNKITPPKKTIAKKKVIAKK